jgi:enoyl-CoA hydratase
MSPDGTVAWERHEAVGVALIDRPNRRNALNVALCDEVREWLAENHDLRAVVIGGAGDRAFCAGADLAQRAGDAGSLKNGRDDAFRPAFEALLDAVVEFPAPVIAAVNGAALGAGMQLAVACDLRVVARTATFGIPAARLGIVISATNVQRLVDAVGQPTARDVLLTGRSLSFEEAAHVGLVQREAEDAVGSARALAEEIAALAPLSVVGHKAALNAVASRKGLLDADRRLLAEIERNAFESADLREGLAAFAEKRTPRFSGR